MAVALPQPGDLALTYRQPWASLTMVRTEDGGCLKPVENRGWPPPQTLPQWRLCPGCRARWAPGYGEVCRGTSDHGMGHRAERTVPDGPYPFRLWVHAGKAVDQGVRDYVFREDGGEWYLDGCDDGPDMHLPLGALLGTVLVPGCHWAEECGEGMYGWKCARCGQCDAFDEAGHAIKGDWEDRCPGPMVPDTCSPWAEPDQYHWLQTDPQPLAEPIPMKGRQGLWTVPDDVAVTA